MAEQTTAPAVTEHPCPGQPRCSHPVGHAHLEFMGERAVYSALAALLDPWDLPRTAVQLLPARARPPRRRRRRR